MLPTLFVINPHSGKRDIRKIVPLIRKHFSAANIPVEIYVTTGPGDARRAAADGSSSHSAVVAVGGDGTVNEIVNGIIGTECALGLLPIGSGNDFSKAAKYPHGLEQCLEILCKQNAKSIDVGTITGMDNVGRRTQSYFVNACGIGLDAVVANEAGKIPWIRGVMKYTIAASRVLFRFRPAFSVVTCEEFVSEGKHLLISIGNGQCSGGGFYLTPDALLDDGLFDVCIAKDLSTAEVLKILPFVFAGKHGRFRQVSIRRTRKVTVKAESDLVVHVDGEVLGRELRDISVELLRGAMRIIIP